MTDADQKMREMRVELLKTELELKRLDTLRIRQQTRLAPWWALSTILIGSAGILLAIALMVRAF